jgi:quinol monooxygenase YgiN
MPLRRGPPRSRRHSTERRFCAGSRIGTRTGGGPGRADATYAAAVSPVVIFSRLQARPGTRAELAAAFDDLHAAVASEPGTLVFTMHAARDEPDVVLFYEVYESDDALAAHRESEAVRAVVGRLDGLLEGAPTITYASVLRSKVPE